MRFCIVLGAPIIENLVHALDNKLSEQNKREEKFMQYKIFLNEEIVIWIHSVGGYDLRLKTDPDWVRIIVFFYYSKGVSDA